MKHVWLSALTLVFSLIGHQAMAAGDAAAGQQKAAACASCHGADGNSPAANFPKLAGQGAAYLAKQIKDFKAAETRKDPIMAGMVAALSDQDAEDIAAYYASQQQSPGAADDNANLKLGENIYRGGITGSSVGACIGCHGPQGKGNPAAKFPAVSGQHAQYLLTQLQKFRTEERANDPGEMMRTIASRMTDEEMKSVAEYMARLY